MSFPLDNLGGYGEVVKELKKHGGDIKKFYESIGCLAVEKERPYMMMQGGVAALVICRLIKLCKKGIDAYNIRKLLIEKEAIHKENFEHVMLKIDDDCLEEDYIAEEENKESFDIEKRKIQV